MAGDYNEREEVMVSRRREQSETMRDMLSALALCNNVTPVESVSAVADFDDAEDAEYKIDDLNLDRRPSRDGSMAN